MAVASKAEHHGSLAGLFHGRDYGGTGLLMTILLIVLVVLLVAGLPTWNHSAEWGYGPSGIVGILLIILLVLLLTGHSHL